MMGDRMHLRVSSSWPFALRPLLVATASSSFSTLVFRACAVSSTCPVRDLLSSAELISHNCVCDQLSGPVLCTSLPLLLSASASRLASGPVIYFARNHQGRRTTATNHVKLFRSLSVFSIIANCSEWLLLVVQMTSPVSRHGRGVAFARIYAHPRALIKITMQEGLVRVDPKSVQREQEVETKSKLWQYISRVRSRRPIE
ncbi:hypothetical protein JB92DRAFT_1459022 [Gautieria morchelliformis]|nr:hypothetical protein JB92DRAFT_1459022 [Gautieria morchelliformis]